MFLNINNINSEITERLNLIQTAELISFSLKSITNFLNNPFISKINETSTSYTFSSTSEEVDGKIYNLLSVDIPKEKKILEGMSISIYGTDFLDGIYLVKEVEDEGVIFWNEANFPSGESFEEEISWYAMGLPNSGMDKIISEIIEIFRLDTKDKAGISSVTQGVDTYNVKQGSTLRHYVSNVLQGYYFQPYNYILEGFLSL